MNQQEEELRKYIVKLLNPYFKVFEDVKGVFTHWNETRTVLMDLGVLPKQHLIDQGFPNYFIGIEVKFFDLDKKEWDHVRKMKLALNQCLTYKYSKFGEAKMEPAAILLADNINTKFIKYDKQVEEAYIHCTEDIRHMCFGQNIGSLNHSRYQGTSFRFISPFWSEKDGFRRPDLLHLHAGNRGTNNPISPVEICSKKLSNTKE